MPNNASHNALRAAVNRAIAEGSPVFVEIHPGQIAYEEDCRRKPTYHDGTPRKSWEQLDEIEQLSWRRNPTPRNYR